MREILFRAQVSDWDERWIEGFLVINRGTSMIFCENPVGMFVVDPETVGQFTGLYDKNSKKIFEGDIIKLFLVDDVEIGVVKFNDIMCRFMFYHKSGGYEFDSDCVIEVIGNMWDSPELLKGEKNVH